MFYTIWSLSDRFRVPGFRGPRFGSEVRVPGSGVGSGSRFGVQVMSCAAGRSAAAELTCGREPKPGTNPEPLNPEPNPEPGTEPGTRNRTRNLEPWNPEPIRRSRTKMPVCH